jgi:hypothetical protein
MNGKRYIRDYTLQAEHRDTGEPLMMSKLGQRTLKYYQGNRVYADPCLRVMVAIMAGAGYKPHRRKKSAFTKREKQEQEVRPVYTITFTPHG